MSCNDYLMELRLRKAASFCGNTGYGQYDQPGLWESTARIIFYIVFKKKYGCMPVQYRRQIKEEQENGK